MISDRADKSSLSSYKQPTYPIKDRRYWLTWWNANSQNCYTNDDLSLLKRIHTLYQSVKDDKSDYFTVSEQSRWHNWWTCNTPSISNQSSRLDSNSFTLPSREAKDSKAYPLWNYADNMARQIANWLSERVKNQDPNLMNDPVRLVFEELLDWFYNDLSGTECKIEMIEHIAKRQSYIKNLVHLIPNFGADRLRLHEIQRSLDDAARTVRSCIANKELPQLLSDIIISGKSLESTLGTYLHFLMIDEEVTDNYSSDYLDGNRRNCQLSPVCKIYQSLEQSNDNRAITSDVSRYKAVNRFYDIVKIAESSGTTQVQLKLKENLVNVVKFASFATNQDKKNYLEAIAALEALINVRKTLEKFSHVQSSVGTYVFAVNYVEKANTLATHYINLITKTKLLIKGLISSADNGLNNILGNTQRRMQNIFFEKNLRALETRVAKGTTVSAQLDSFCHHAVESMNKYQQEMKKLVNSVNTGEASHEIEVAMRDLYEQMHYLNVILPGLLGESYIQIIAPTDAVCNPALSSIDSCKVMSGAVSANEIAEPVIANPQSFVETNTAHSCAREMLKIDAGKWDIRHTNGHSSPIIIFQLLDGDKSVASLEFFGQLSEVKHDSYSNEPVFVYSYQDNGQEIGTAEFYGQPDFCVSPDRQRHNIVKTSGMFKELIISEERMASEIDICRVLPPSLLNTMASNAGNSALHGFLRGGATVISDKFTVSSLTRQIINQATYLGCVFTWKFGSYYSQIPEEEKVHGSVNALYKAACYAAYETGQIAVLNIGLNMISSIFAKAGNLLEKNKWHLTGGGLKKAGSIFRYGFFGYNVIGKNISDPAEMAKAAAITAVSVASGAATEIATQKAAKALF